MNTDIAYTLEDRLSIIEAVVLPEPIHPTIVIPKDDPSSSIIGALQSTEKQLKRIGQDHKLIGTFLNQYSSVQPLLDATDKSMFMDPLIIRELVENSLDGLDHLVGQLEALQDLSPQLDVKFKDLEKKQQMINDLSKDLVEIQVQETSEDFLKLLSSYTEFSFQISQLFVNYHQILNELEERFT